ncbi:Translation initiation factor eIF-2B subunit alpha [Neolecta irregularis DAH-3]|uniref:Translation initiation factor eIF2B subunit alpha n=1 Tax=Neolecta irregularis (strain DAH-3) TaxID=1198029 RepID=A0A1U7LHC1_NEOID|nr:Translation initiation factor eIF-2B subunit alpha [Neolecta irregularis DAH-3]|eukprot:OLL22056.1 Translation initiation factor eIF-2B subunit alpha [Neolecta irregularis DAH-3]
MTSTLASGIVHLGRGEFDILRTYTDILKRDEEITMPLATIEALVSLLESSNATTMSEFTDIIQRGIQVLKGAVNNRISVAAGCDLFQSSVTREVNGGKDFDVCKRSLISNAKLFSSQARQCRSKISRIGKNIIKDNSTILIHSFSRVVTAILLHAASQNTRFKVFVTEGRPTNGGKKACQKLNEMKIPTCMILDAAVGYVMGMVDLVLVGAEGVVESGGLINQLGAYQLSVLARTCHKPFYAAAESHKFIRLFPLSQYDLPTAHLILKFSTDYQSKDGSAPNPGSIDSLDNPALDYTPPEYISGLITDLGVLTPSAVSEELIRRYL